MSGIRPELGFVARRTGALTPGEKQIAVVVIAINLLLGLGLTAIYLTRGVEPHLLMRDITAIAKLPPWTGAYGFVAVLFFAIGASIALFTATLLRGAEMSTARTLLIVGGFYLGFGCLDDLYTLHEHGLFIGLSEKKVLALHLGLLGGVLIAAYPVWRNTPWPVLIMALGCFVVSTILDVLPTQSFAAQGWGEEVFETTGTALLSAYFVLTAHRALSGRAPGPLRS